MELFELPELEVKEFWIFLLRGCLNNLTLHYQNSDPLVLYLYFFLLKIVGVTWISKNKFQIILVFLFLFFFKI